MPLNELLSNAAHKGASMRAINPAPKMCNDCAFKKGTDANNDEFAVDAAANCLAFEGNFHCHRIGPNGEFLDEGKPCAGFLYAKQYMESIGE